ncbi:MAG: hydantoinase/oxoprolinase family protein [Candidatus Bathyarchaeia archaeon]
MPAYRVAVDVGGTFTDVFVYDEHTGEIRIAKSPSTPINPAIGVMEALKKSSIAPAEMVFFSHGSTVGTNALITRNFPRTGLVATKGFRDVIEIRRGVREDIWDAYKDPAPPYVKRRDRLEVDERTDYTGTILKPLSEDEARSIARVFKRRGIASIAISFINAYMNGENERIMKQILQSEYPEAFVCTSHEVVPEIFEHERTSTTAVNACLGPVVSHYLYDLTRRLKEAGYTGDAVVMHSGGGVMTAESIAFHAARIANSGPAAGAIAGAYFAKLCGFQNSIGLDMGGTSTDVSLMFNGEMRIAREWWVEFGYPILFPCVDMVSIGAGGGSVAWIDEGGSLRNGPRSMGADPGPACYMKGGTEPTNTDANMLLGRLNPDMFLGGAMKVDKNASEEAIKQKIGDPLGLDAVQAADAMIKVANSNMCDAVRLMSVRRGYDPREFSMVVFGGAGPLHGAYVAAELSIPALIIPLWPGITSALGCLLTDIKHDLSKTYISDVAEVNADLLEREFTIMEEEAAKRLRAEGTPEDRQQMLRYMDMRYVGQWRSLTVSCSRPIGDSLEAVCDKFHVEHQREYAYSARDQSVETYGLRVSAIGLTDKPKLPKLPRTGTAETALKGSRNLYLSEAGGFVETKVYDRSKLSAGAILTGPAVVEQIDSTVLIPTEANGEVDDYGNIIISIK